MADGETAVLAADTYDFASPAAIERAINTAMSYYERKYASDARPVPARTAELANVDARESDVREGLRRLLANGRIVRRPNLEREQFEGTAAFDASHFFVENQLDIKMVAGARLWTYLLRLPR